MSSTFTGFAMDAQAHQKVGKITFKKSQQKSLNSILY
jgi:hypothetical protein